MTSDSGRAHLAARFLLLVVALELYPLCLSATNEASGWFSPHCDGAFFSLVNVDGLPKAQKLNMTMRHYALSWQAYRPQETWENVYAERCSPSGKCETATSARIWLDKCEPNDKHISGKNKVTFGEEHLQGRLHLKYRKQESVCM